MRGDFYARRNHAIFCQYQTGDTVEGLAKQYNVCSSRVYSIIRREKAKFGNPDCRLPCVHYTKLKETIATLVAQVEALNNNER